MGSEDIDTKRCILQPMLGDRGEERGKYNDSFG